MHSALEFNIILGPKRHIDVKARVHSYCPATEEWCVAGSCQLQRSVHVNVRGHRIIMGSESLGELQELEVFAGSFAAVLERLVNVATAACVSPAPEPTESTEADATADAIAE
jgi:hypothetical protein